MKTKNKYYRNFSAMYESLDNEGKEEFLKDEVSEEVRDILIDALEEKNEGVFDAVMTTLADTNEATSITQVHPDVVNVDPEVVATEEVADVDDTKIEELKPLVTSLLELTEEVNSDDFEIPESLPVEIAEGLGAIKESSDDFSVKVVRRALDKLLSKRDFSAGDVDVSDIPLSEMLAATAESANELKSEGEGKTTLTKAVEEIAEATKSDSLESLYKMRSSLMEMRSEVEEFIDTICDRDDLGLSPKLQKSLVTTILDEGLFEGDGLEPKVVEILQGSSDFSSSTDEEKVEFLEGVGELELDMNEVDEIVQDALEDAGSFSDLLEAVEEEIESLEGKGEDEGEITKTSFDSEGAIIPGDHSVDPTVAALAALGPRGASTSILDILPQNPVDPIEVKRTPTQEAYVAMVKKRDKKSHLPAFLGGPGSESFKNLDKRIRHNQLAYIMPSLANIYGKKLNNDLNAAGIDGLMSDASDIMLANLMTKQFSAEGEDAAVEQGLTNDDNFLALISKYKALPTLDTKTAFLNDLVAQGMDPIVVQKIQDQGDGNFTPMAPAPMDASANEGEDQGQVPPAPVAPYDEEGDIFDAIVDPSDLFTADPVDGTLPPGRVQEEGVQQGNLGKFDRVTELQLKAQEEDQQRQAQMAQGQVDPEFEAIV